VTAWLRAKKEIRLSRSPTGFVKENSGYRGLVVAPAPPVVAPALEFPEVVPLTPAVGLPGLIGWLGLVVTPGPVGEVMLGEFGEVMLGEVVVPGEVVAPPVFIDPPVVGEPTPPAPPAVPAPGPVVVPVPPPLIEPELVPPAPPAPPAPAAPAPPAAACAQSEAEERAMMQRKPVIRFIGQPRSIIVLTL
jgi:hypothetical protein